MRAINATIFSGLFSLAVLAPITVRAQSADQQYTFAESLRNGGDQAFALLEYKRFVFQNPNHVKAPDALVAIGSLYLTYFGDVAKAQATFKTVKEKYPTSEASKQATTLNDFIDINSDFDGKPLIVYLKGRQQESQSNTDAAVASYLSVARDYPKARLADDGIIDAARVYFQDGTKYTEAAALYDRVPREYPESSRLIEVQYMRACIVEETNKDPLAAIAAYEQVAPGQADNAYRKLAAEAVERLRKNANLIERQYDKAFVRQYQLVKTDVNTKGLYLVVIQVPTSLSTREVQATMEEALLVSYTNRKQPTDTVRVEAWFTVNVTKAGLVNWVPGATPAFTVYERKSEDVMKDVLMNTLFK